MLAGVLSGLAGREVLGVSVMAAGASGFLLVPSVRAGAESYRDAVTAEPPFIRPWLFLSAMH
jgi:hypothetical protein